MLNITKEKRETQRPTQQVKILVLGELSFNYSQKLRAKLPSDQYHITATSADSEQEVQLAAVQEECNV